MGYKAMCRVKVLFWRNPAVPLHFSRVSASFRYMAMCRVFQKRTQCVPQQCACARFVLSLSLPSVDASVLTFSGQFALFLLFVPLFFKKCVQADIFMECSCFSSLHPCRRSPDGLHSFCCLRLCFSKNALERTASVSAVAFRCHVRVSFLDRRLALAFLLLAQCFSRKRTQAGVFRVRFFLLCVFDIFAFRKPPRTGVCGGVLACFYIVCVFSSQQRAVSAHSDRFCREDLHRMGLYRMGFAGSALSGWLHRIGFTGSALPGWLCRVGFTGSACAVRPVRARARGGRSHGSSRDVCLTVKHINALNRCFIE